MLTTNAPGLILRDEMLEPWGRTAFPVDRGQTVRIVDVDGRIRIEEPLSKAGDLIDLRAETDLPVAISNCPQERNPCNAYKPTRLRVVVFGPPPA